MHRPSLADGRTGGNELLEKLRIGGQEGTSLTLAVSGNLLDEQPPQARRGTAK